MSPRAYKNLTFEEKIEKKITALKPLVQYQKMAKTLPKQAFDDEMYAKARQLVVAAEQRAIDKTVVKKPQIDIGRDSDNDSAFREARMEAYQKEHGIWNDAGDRGLLFSLIELETQQRRIIRDLERTRMSSEKERYWKALKENASSQQSLQQTLGIDKKSREQAKIVANPMENWENIKQDVGDFFDGLINSFPENAAKARTEEELRDVMKHHLSWPFPVIDAVIEGVKRIHGLKLVTRGKHGIQDRT